MSQRLNDEDVDRIASRVVEKVLTYALVIAAAMFLVPGFIVAFATLTNGLPLVVTVAILASVIAAPLVALIWVSARRAR